MEERLVLLNQIGNGNAFTRNITNTSFLLFNNTILIDCGYNVFSSLTDKMLSSIRHIFITHKHFDHVGSLESLLYYFEYVLNKDINLYYHEKNTELCDLFNIMFNDKIETFNHIKIKPFNETCFLNVGDDLYVKVQAITTDFHNSTLNTCYLFTLTVNKEKLNTDKNKFIIQITGDTKANIIYENFLRDEILNCIAELNNFYILHDVSYVDNPAHATIEEIGETYSLMYLSHTVVVHEGKEKHIKIEIPLKTNVNGG